MKLIPAGNSSYTQLIFNCTRNRQCQKLFYVPIRQYSDLVFYADLPGKPDMISVEVYNTCDLANLGSAVFADYVVGTKPDGTWYGVFGNPTMTPGSAVPLTCFFFKITFQLDSVDYVYYSQQICLATCETLMKLESCFPNEPKGTDAFDCNGIYYGVPNNEDTLGTANYRYFHWGFLRMASIYEQSNKLSFSRFNSKRAYKNTLSRNYVLEFELVPTFYKDFLLGILSRGNIKADGVEYSLAEDQTFEMVDTDAKLWDMSPILTEECKNTFGCGSSCEIGELPPAPCVLPDLEFEYTDTELGIDGTISGILLAGTTVDWEIYDKFSGVKVAFGNTADGTFTAAGVNTAESCYRIRWRVQCPGEEEDTPSDWSSMLEFGDCEGGGGVTWYNYQAERYLCSYCSAPFDDVVIQSTNPSLTLFKYYKAMGSTTEVFRPISTSPFAPSFTIIGTPYNSCVLACNAELPPE